jgi:aromatic-L-amino-acid decarboxylase
VVPRGRRVRVVGRLVVLTRDQTGQTAAYGRPGVDAPAYLRSAQRGISVDTTYFADRGMQLSRGVRALKVWMSMKEQGVDRIGAAIGRNIDQAQRLARLVAEHPQLELMAPVPMNTVCFRYVGDGDRALDLDPINQEIVATLQVHGVAVPSQTILDHGFAIRVCITNHRSEDSDFDLLVDEVVRIGSRLRGDAVSAG